MPPTQQNAPYARRNNADNPLMRGLTMTSPTPNVPVCVICAEPARIEGGVCSTRCLTQLAHQRVTGCMTWPCDRDHGERQ